MNIKIIHKDVQITDYIKELIDEKFLKTAKYLHSDHEIKVNITQEREQKIVDVHAYDLHKSFKAEAKNKDLVVAIDDAKHKIESQIIKHKEKVTNKHK